MDHFGRDEVVSGELFPSSRIISHVWARERRNLIYGVEMLLEELKREFGI